MEASEVTEKEREEARRRAVQDLSYDEVAAAVWSPADPFYDAHQVPADNIAEERIPKQHKTRAPEITESTIQSLQASTVREILVQRSKDGTRVHMRYSDEENALQPKRAVPSIQDSEWPDKPLGDPEKEGKLFLSVSILRRYKGEEDDESDKLARANAQRADFCEIAPPSHPLCCTSSMPLGRSPISTNERQKSECKVFAECTNLQFSIGNFEPFFCTATLYDVATKNRLSESWTFHMNQDMAMSLLGNIPTPFPVTSSPEAVFTVRNPAPEVFLVVRVEKVLRMVELEAAVEPYYKNPLKPKEKEKLLKEYGQTISKLADYRQAFAWGAVQLFNEYGSMTVGDLTQVRLVKSKVEDTEASILEAIKKGKQRSDKKPLPAEFTFNFKLLAEGEMPPNSVNPSLLQISEPTSSNDKVVREIQEFSEPQMVGNYDLVHHLYVYPESVNFTKHKDSNCRNIAVKVRLRDSDADPNADGLPCITGRTCAPKVISDYVSSVTFHKKTPNFSDEVKVELPLNITEDHHLLFVFVNANVQKGKSSAPVDTFLGMANVSLFSQSNRILEDQRLSIPVAAVPAPNYLSPDVESSVKYVDNKRPVFTVRTKLVSNLYSQDPGICMFLKCATDFMQEKGSNADIIEAMKCMVSTSSATLATYFDALVMLLLRFACSNKENVAKQSLATIFGVVSAMGSLPEEEGIQKLVHFLQLQFDHSSDFGGSYPFESIPHHWAALLHEQHPITGKAQQFAWFFLSLIIKSIILSVLKKGASDYGDRKAVLPTGFAPGLKKLLLSLAAPATADSTLNTCVSFFLRDLMSVLSREVTFPLIHTYIVALSSAPAKFASLRIICFHEFFATLNIPVLTEITQVGTISLDFWKRHFLVGLLLEETAAAVKKDASARKIVLETVGDVLWKMESSPLALQSPELKGRYISMFFPLIQIVIENRDLICEGNSAESALWANSVFLLLKHCDRDKHLRAWWRADTQKNHVALLDVLSSTLAALEDAHLIRECSFVALDFLEDFMADFEEDLLAEESKLMEAVFGLLMELFKQRQTVSLLSSLFMSIRRFIHKFGQVIFVYNNTTYCSLLCQYLLGYTNCVNVEPRSQAGSLVYLMIKTNFTLKGNFSRMKLQSTIAISKLCGESGVSDFSRLQTTLEYVAKLSQREFKDISLGNDVEDLTIRLFKVIRDSVKINEYHYDPEMTADLTYDVSVGYEDSPDLRLTWLENLAKMHRDQKNYEEVAQCKFCIASLIISCLNLGGMKVGIPNSEAELLRVSPNITQEAGLPKTAGSGEEQIFNSGIFSEEGLVDTLCQAIQYLKMGERYETCIDVYNILLEFYQSHRDFQRLASSFRDLKSVCDVLVASIQAHSRLFNIYYRVGFYGKGFKELDGKEAIYKEPNFMRIADFTQKLKTQFCHISGKEPIILPNTTVDIAKLDPSSLHVQIVSVEPFFDEQDQENRTTEWDRNYNIKYFMFETPFTTTGKAHGDLSVQCKRKTILETEKSFPYIKKRLVVVGRKEIILQPIQNAIEIIESRKNALRRELELNPPNMKTLQINLQGAVLAQVNSGPMEIARTFLGANAQQFPTEHVQHLVKVLQEFKNVCGFALKLNNKLIGPDQLSFQNECEKGYAAFRQDVDEIIKKTL